jgi:hypothetical protein
MTLPAFRVEATRGPLTESVHPVSAAVVDASGRLLASAGNPELVTWWRSAAKPFQALPLLLDGVADRFGFAGPELALASASHSSEPVHLEAIARFMEKAGVREAELACGPHTPLSPAVAEAVIRDGVVPTPRWSNCSGKHTGMLALARHHGWPREGYNAVGHPVQDRILDEVCRWTGADRDAIRTAPDGCTAACFALPLRNMASAGARLAASTAPAARLLRDDGHPFSSRHRSALHRPHVRLAGAVPAGRRVHCAALLNGSGPCRGRQHARPACASRSRQVLAWAAPGAPSTPRAVPVPVQPISIRGVATSHSNPPASCGFDGDAFPMLSPAVA